MLSTSKTILTAAALLLCVSSANSALIDLTTEGIWSAGELTNHDEPNGLGSSTISWGQPYQNGPLSSYNFTGSVLTADASNSTPFILGTFTHNNYPIYQPSLVKAELDVTVDIEGTTFGGLLEFDFRHWETPNDADPCAGTGLETGVACPDIVTISAVKIMEDIFVDGSFYELSIFGFKNDANGGYTTQFITAEGASNSAHIYASIKQASVPEPGSLALMGLGLIGLGFSRRKAANS